MKDFGKWFVSMFEETPGVLSSKRVQSFLLIGVAIGMVAFKAPTDQIIAMLSASAVLQGITAFQK